MGGEIQDIEIELEIRMGKVNWSHYTPAFLTVSKSHLHYTRGSTPKRVTSGGAHLRGLAPGLHAPKESRSGVEPFATLCRFDRPEI